MSWIGLHEFADVIFGITQEWLYITTSNLVWWYVTSKEIFVNLFCNLKSDWSLEVCAHFFAWFFHKNVPYLTLYQWTKFQCHTFFHSQDIKPNVLFSSYLDSSWCHVISSWYSWFIFDEALKQWLTERKKEGKMEIKIHKYLENEESFLGEIKNIFHSFWRAIIWW